MPLQRQGKGSDDLVMSPGTTPGLARLQDMWSKHIEVPLTTVFQTVFLGYLPVHTFPSGHLGGILDFLNP